MGEVLLYPQLGTSTKAPGNLDVGEESSQLRSLVLLGGERVCGVEQIFQRIQHVAAGDGCIG